MLLRATRQNPKDPASWIALGEVELAQGDRLAAQREFTEVLRLQSQGLCQLEAIVGSKAHFPEQDAARALLTSLRK